MDRKPLIFAVGALFIVLASFALGFYRGRVTAPVKVVEKPAEHVVTETVTKTDIQYVPKVTTADPDVDIKIPKQEIKVAVNGKEQAIKKTDSEKYIFDENKLQLEHYSKSSVDIKVPVVDKTRHWSIGIGASRNGTAGMLRFPISGHVGGWVYGDKRTVAGGVSMNF